MTVYFSPTAKGFFDSSLHSVLPADAKEITAETYTSLLTAQGKGQLIQSDANGNPEAVAPPVPAVTAASALAGLAALYAAKEALGVSFQAAGATAASVFPSDLNAQVKLVSAYSMATAGLWVDGTPWLSTTGVSVPMAKADVLALAPKVAAYVAACTARYGALIPLVSATPTTDTSTGWPSNA